MSEPLAHWIGEPAEGPLIVLVHGLEDNWHSWLPMARHLGPAWRCLALDLPWRAGNDYGWRRHGSPGAWLTRELGKLGEPVAALVAHSFGAAAVLETLTGGAPVRAAVLTAPLYRPPGQALTWKVFDKSRQRFGFQVSEGVRLRLGARAAAMNPAVVEAMCAKALERIGPAGFLTVFEQYLATAEFALGEVTVPTLILGGCADPSFGATHGAALAAHMPAATVVLEDGYDHFLHVRRAADVAPRVARFVAAACGPAAGGPVNGRRTREVRAWQ